MARLIDAKVLERQVKATFKDTNPVLMGQMLRWVRCQTTIDAVPVVRCKDCKHWQESVDGIHKWCPLLMDIETKADDFCSYGERKDDGKNT